MRLLKRVLSTKSRTTHIGNNVRRFDATIKWNVFTGSVPDSSGRKALGYGILFATFITLILTPSLLMIQWD